VLLENSFVVPAPVEAAWELLNDVPSVVPCMPGAELVEGGGDAWKAKLDVKLGPIALRFLTDVRREEVDEAGRRIVLTAKAREARGRGEVRFDLPVGIDQERHARVGVGDEVASVSKARVEELLDQQLARTLARV